MPIAFLEEPELEFGSGRHIDIRFGLLNHGPLDYASSLAPRDIRLGIVGTNQTIEGVASWLDKCRTGTPAKPSRQPYLFPRFPGFAADSPFHATLVMEPRLQRAISPREFDKFRAYSSPNQIVVEAVQLLFAELEYLTENTAADVLLVSVPGVLLDAMNAETALKGDEDDDEVRGPTLDFHHLLKAKCMGLSKALPAQIVLPETYTGKGRRGKRRRERLGRLQDEATRAWNIHNAIYYKANGVPW